MIVAPSLLAADFARLEDSVKVVEHAGADWLHCDVMDGVFVPNISFGFPVIKAVAGVTALPLDVHLMIVNPDRYIGAVRDCGAMMMNVHQEACPHLHRTVQSIHDAGMKAGVTLNPTTPVCMLEDIIADVDMVLLMSVNPGFGGQTFIRHTLAKIRTLRELIIRSGSRALIEVDGGINSVTAPAVAQAGADVFVAGSAVFRSENPAEIIQSFKSL